MHRISGSAPVLVYSDSFFYNPFKKLYQHRSAVKIHRRHGRETEQHTHQPYAEQRRKAEYQYCFLQTAAFGEKYRGKGNRHKPEQRVHTKCRAEIPAECKADCPRHSAGGTGYAEQRLHLAGYAGNDYCRSAKRRDE